MSMPEPAFDAQGYPTEATLKIIEVWPYQDFFSLMAFVYEAWHDNGKFNIDGDFFILTTGGWSGNEEIISALQSNHLFWSTCWEKSERGGYFEFKIPQPPPEKRPM